MSAVDHDLRAALDRLYPAADADGVASDVWERYSAGEAGTPGGRADLRSGGGILSLALWIGAAALVGLLAFGAGVAGLFDPAREVVPLDPATAPILISEVEASDCPWGAGVTRLPQHSRVLAVQRNDDASWIGVRDPRTGAVVWVHVMFLVSAPGVGFDTLPVAGCANGVIPVDPTTGPEAATPEEEAAANPPDVPDTVAPTFGTPSVTYTPATGYVCTENPSSSAIILAPAFDDRLVTSVTATWNGSGPGTAQLSSTVSGWALNYRPTNLSITEAITFTLVARDAAGNTSAPVQVVVQRDQCPG